MPIYISGHKCVLSNFYPEPVVIYGRSFKSREHAYTHQKALFHNKEHLAEEVKQAAHAGQAKRLGKMKTDPGWMARKVTVMEEIIGAILRQSNLFKTTLIKTGDRMIVEDVSDEFWGRGVSGEGLNMFGKILMKYRDRVKTTDQPKDVKGNTEVEKEDIERNSSRQKPYEHNNEVILLGNSILKGIIPERLCSKFISDKASAFTTSSVLECVDKCNKTYKCVVLQLITNDVMSKGPAEITKEMESLVLRIHQKWKPKSVIISAAPPVKDPEMNCAISITNAMCRKLANRSKLSVFCSHDNFYYRGQQDSRLFLPDGIHLSSEGTKLLSNNLKHIILEELDIYLSYRQQEWRSWDQGPQRRQDYYARNKYRINGDTYKRNTNW